MNRVQKYIFAFALFLLAYGYLCRVIGIYFFWESKYIGWSLIFVSLMLYLLTRIKIRKTQRKKTIWHKIGVGVIIFALLIQVILLIILPNSDAYKVSKEFLLNDQHLKNEIGNVKSFSVIPVGQIQKKSNEGGDVSGSAQIVLIVKGDKKYKDVMLYVEKVPERDWTVIAVE